MLKPFFRPYRPILGEARLIRRGPDRLPPAAPDNRRENTDVSNAQMILGQIEQRKLNTRENADEAHRQILQSHLDALCAIWPRMNQATRNAKQARVNDILLQMSLRGGVPVYRLERDTTDTPYLMSAGKPAIFPRIAIVPPAPLARNLPPQRPRVQPIPVVRRPEARPVPPSALPRGLNNAPPTDPIPESIAIVANNPWTFRDNILQEIQTMHFPGTTHFETLPNPAGGLPQFRISVDGKNLDFSVFGGPGINPCVAVTDGTQRHLLNVPRGSMRNAAAAVAGAGLALNWHAAGPQLGLGVQAVLEGSTWEMDNMRGQSETMPSINFKVPEYPYQKISYKLRFDPLQGEYTVLHPSGRTVYSGASLDSHTVSQAVLEDLRDGMYGKSDKPVNAAPTDQVLTDEMLGGPENPGHPEIYRDALLAKLNATQPRLPQGYQLSAHTYKSGWRDTPSLEVMQLFRPGQQPIYFFMTRAGSRTAAPHLVISVLPTGVELFKQYRDASIDGAIKPIRNYIESQRWDDTLRTVSASLTSTLGLTERGDGVTSRKNGALIMLSVTKNKGQRTYTLGYDTDAGVFTILNAQNMEILRAPTIDAARVTEVITQDVQTTMPGATVEPPPTPEELVDQTQRRERDLVHDALALVKLPTGCSLVKTDVVPTGDQDYKYGITLKTPEGNIPFVLLKDGGGEIFVMQGTDTFCRVKYTGRGYNPYGAYLTATDALTALLERRARGRHT